MDDLNYKSNVIDKLIKQCEQSKLVSFTYQDPMFSLCFSKVEAEADHSTNVLQKVTMENASELKKGNIAIDFDEYGITDISEMDIQENEDIIL